MKRLVILSLFTLLLSVAVAEAGVCSRVAARKAARHSAATATVRGTGTAQAISSSGSAIATAGGCANGSCPAIRPVTGTLTPTFKLPVAPPPPGIKFP